MKRGFLKKLSLLVCAVLCVTAFVGCDGGGGGGTPSGVKSKDHDWTLSPVDGTVYTRYTDSWRSVKTDGWAISSKSSEAVRDRLLKLFDYMYSEDGNRLMSYGPSDWIDGTTEYNGRTIPALSEAALFELDHYARGNYTDYYREFLGGTLPIGYLKEQGMEYQTVHKDGQAGLNNILSAVDNGTLGHAVVSDGSYEFTNVNTDTLLPISGSPVTVKMAVMYQQNSKITFNKQGVTDTQSSNSGYRAANGKLYRVGLDIKPVWEEIEKNLNIKIDDVSSKSSATSNNAQWQELGGFPELFDVITTTVGNINNAATLNGTFVNLLPHLDKMPNFKNFLDNNPFIKNQIITKDSSGNDALFYTPYFDGYDDLERMFIMRSDWVEKLLDGATTPSLDTALTINNHYTPFMPSKLDEQFVVTKRDRSGVETITKKYEANIIDTQNALASKNGETLTKALRAHIDTTYNGYYGTKRSELFVGANAAYDTDELVALLRCVKANPLLLTGNASTNIVPFYPRNNTADRAMDVVRFAQIFGVRGLDARNNWLYINEAGQLSDSRTRQKTLAGIAKLNQLYKEDLILQNFHSPQAANSTQMAMPVLEDGTFRGRLNTNNRGFMTYDYNQTTTVLNALSTGTTETNGTNIIKIDGFCLSPVLPPFTDWNLTTESTEEEKANLSSTVPTTLPFSQSQQTLIGNYRSLTDRFNINDNNGSSSNLAGTGGQESNMAFMWLVMHGFGADIRIGSDLHEFASLEKFANQVSVTWNVNSYEYICRGAYASIVARG